MVDLRTRRHMGGWSRRAAKGVMLTLGTCLTLSLGSLVGMAEGTRLASPVVAAAQGTPPRSKPGIPVRIRVPDLGIDLPVVSSERQVPGNTRDYPLCDVAQYWTIFDLPGAPGTTWIYAHAQPGMFLPLFLTADATSGSGLLGKLVTLQLDDGRLLRYRVIEVKQHAYDRRIALRPRPGQHRLILQTSEGPPGTIPKLQVAAKLVGARWTDKPAPRAKPRACWQPRATTTSGTPRKRDRDRASATPLPATVVVTSGSDGNTSAIPLAIGGVAVMLGSLLLAVYLVRRPPAGRRRPVGAMVGGNAPGSPMVPPPVQPTGTSSPLGAGRSPAGPSAFPAGTAAPPGGTGPSPPRQGHRP